jgi:large conductance mechanosensitive channel
MLKEFKNFIMTSNVIDLAVAVIMAGAMGLVTNGFVNDIIMPIVGEFTGGMDFSELRYVLSTSVAEDGKITENAIRYGAWMNTLINLLTVGFVMFMIVKAYNKTKTPPPPPPAKGPTTEELLIEIRDALKKSA